MVVALRFVGGMTTIAFLSRKGIGKQTETDDKCYEAGFTYHRIGRRMNLEIA